MDSIFIAAISLIAGVLLRLSGRLPADADRVLAVVVIQFCVPPVAFLAARAMPLTPEILLPGSMAWIMFAGAFLFFGLFARLLGLSRQTFGCLMLTGGLSNVIFIGLPMIEAFFGPNMAYVAFLCDNPGTSVVLAVPAVLLASHLSGQNDARSRREALLDALKRMLLFPPFQALVLGLLLRPVALPDFVLSGLSRIGTTLVPLSLVTVGLGLTLRLPGSRTKALTVGLAYKLALAPALIWLVAAQGFGNTGLVAQVTVFEAAMPPMVLGAILATESGLDAELASLMVGIGTLLSFATLPVWRWLLGGL
ncbi:MAG: AEC family transporter [Humidesulfovibrio sp.]|uniref:AEC family transporter n=1 Tax=Humidesulfovibrio sp. TaxID=2910988 RepID=UPI0027FBCE7B|nr:AEC family transporter [Humidesulfovibrio sp.]MDQ7833924.1 AEC family transporter [Humidesulfovibrio sp.]